MRKRRVARGISPPSGASRLVVYSSMASWEGGNARRLSLALLPFVQGFTDAQDARRKAGPGHAGCSGGRCPSRTPTPHGWRAVRGSATGPANVRRERTRVGVSPPRGNGQTQSDGTVKLWVLGSLACAKACLREGFVSPSMELAEFGVLSMLAFAGPVARCPLAALRGNRLGWCYFFMKGVTSA